MPHYIEKIEKLTLPTVAMRDVVAFPSIPLSFEVQREASVGAVNLASGRDMYVFLVAQKDIATKEPNINELYSVGVVSKIKQIIRSSDGIIRVISEGNCRATLMNMRRDENGVIIADVLAKTLIIDSSTTGVRSEALFSEAISAADKCRKYLPGISPEIINTAKSINNPGLLADFLAANMLVRFIDKQEVLEIYDPIKRLETTIALIEGEEDILRAELDLHNRVKEQIDENQRDYYLREQLKALQSELGMTGEDDFDEYSAKIAEAKLPAHVAEKLNRENQRLSKTPSGSPDANVLRNYIEAVLDIPWGKKTKDRLDIVKAREILDSDHDGLDKVKERIIEYLAVKQLNPELGNQIICFLGPPGVGKTSLAMSIARAMKRKYARVSLGGIRDEAEIRGHRKTYVGSMPGRIINALTQSGSMNPLLLLDEIDKMCSDMHGDPSSALLEVLDGEQNKYFRDHFIELPVDLSDCMFIATANSLENVPRPLIDRMEIIELHTYTKNEKLAIAKNHLLPKQLKRHGLTRRAFKISDDAIAEIIAHYTAESGVRNLERELASLCRKAAKKLVEGDVKSVSIKRDDVKLYLGVPKIDDEIIGEPLVGVVNGLAYTEVGGDLLKIEAATMDGSGKLELTGSLGDVMKESAHIAISYIRSHAGELGVKSDFYKNTDIHIHVPEGAVPKDGPSAGVTMLTALTSVLSGKPVRSDIAMTGEITLTGRVLPIGGLREKTTAAVAAGVKSVLIPDGNVKDIDELEAQTREALSFIPCKTADDVLKSALIVLEEGANIPTEYDKSAQSDFIVPTVPTNQRHRVSVSSDNI